MFSKTSLRVLLDALPVITVVFEKTGRVIAATPDLWPLLGMHEPDAFPATLPSGEMPSVLLDLHSDAPDTGQLKLHNTPAGTVRVIWRPFPHAGEGAAVACLLPERGQPFSTHDSAATSEEEMEYDLPLDPKASEVLLEQTVDACRHKHMPLSVALLHMTDRDGHALHLADPKLWRAAAHKLRSLCRMSDLLAASESGDFLVILIGATLPQAKVVTKRIMKAFDDWAAISSVLQRTSIRYATWLPDQDGITAASKLLDALGVYDSRQ